MDITKRVQVKLNQVTLKYQAEFSRPVYKFIRDMHYGILCTGHVHLSKIGSSLKEEISLKKTTERLSSHLGREGLDKELTASHLRVNQRRFSECQYLIADMSDIIKPYAEKMEGLDRVYDGSTKEIGDGYWQLNIIGVDKTGTSIMPLVSALYATNQEGGKGFSENKKILESLDTVREHLTGEQIVVYDRGGDRGKLICKWIKEKQYFIIRQTGSRNIFVEGEKKNLKDYAEKIRPSTEITVQKRRGNRIKRRHFQCGARKIYLPKAYGQGPMDTALWLISVTEPGKGKSWYLSYIPVETEREAIEITMQGYGYRWKIEEVHRQVKTDYHLEEICLRRYVALKNFNALFWIVMSFIYCHLEGLSIHILSQSKVPLLYRRKIKECIGFNYYKLAKALQNILPNVNHRQVRDIYDPRDRNQLILTFT